MFDFIKLQHQLGRISEAEVAAFVEKGYISENEAKQIINDFEG